MKIKKTTLFKTILSVGLITTGVVASSVVLTSCSLKNPAPATYDYKTTEVHVQPNASFSKYTVGTWQDLVQKNPEFVLKTIQDSNFEVVKNSGFDLENSYVFSAESQINPESAVLSDLKIKLKNDNQQRALLLVVQGLFNVSSEAFVPPSQSVWNIDQLDLGSIKELDPKDISDPQWTNALNEYDENQNIIPYDLYMLYEKHYDSDNHNKYVLVYKVNPQYNDYIANRKDEFTDVTINVTLSPYLNKVKQTKFTLSESNAKRVFGDNITLDEMSTKASTDSGKVEIINALAKYVESLGNVQPLRPCVGENNTTYGFSFTPVKPSQNDECIITFSNNPNDKQNESISYTFTIDLPAKSSK